MGWRASVLSQKRLRRFVADLDVFADNGLERARVRAALELLVGERCEPALDEIEPRRARWREVKMAASGAIDE
jgi:hypothetical protein